MSSKYERVEIPPDSHLFQFLGKEILRIVEELPQIAERYEQALVNGLVGDAALADRIYSAKERDLWHLKRSMDRAGRGLPTVIYTHGGFG